MESVLLLSPLLLAWLAVPVTALAGRRSSSLAAVSAIVMALLVFAATLWGWLSGGGVFSVPWAPTWNLKLAFALDGLAALYALLAAGIGVLVLLYSIGYLPHHIAEEEHTATQKERSVFFYALLLFFMASMIGLVMAHDLLLLFFFWELTTIASYLLIGFDSHKPEPRRAALMALVVTGVTSLLFLIGALVLYAAYQTFSLPELFRQAQPDGRLTVAVGLIGLAALAKSAQVPFHFWLPRAMAAPTPVSAYLHSAAMVAAGVFLLSRLYPLLRTSDILLNGLIAIGLLSMLAGGVFALKEVALKRVLAYSTIAQYGYVMVLLGLGTQNGIMGAAFYVLAHALIKSGLFLTAGAVTQATQQEQLTGLGGLFRSMPWLAAASGLAAAGLAGLPLTVGFFKDEILFRAALERGNWLAVAAAWNAALTFAYAWRFWRGIFLGPRRAAAHQVPRTLVGPVILLGALILAGGVWQTPFEHLASAAASAAWEGPVSLELAYHLDARLENILAVSAYVLGSLLLLFRPAMQPLLNSISRAGTSAGPERGYSLGARWLRRSSAFFYNFELYGLANRVATVLLPTGALILIGLWVAPSSAVYRVSQLHLQDLPLGLALLLTAVCAVVVTIPRNHLTQILLLSSINFGLAGVFAFFGAPNLALVGVLIGVASTLIFVAFLTLFPLNVLREGEAVRVPASRNRRDIWISLFAGGAAFLVVWRVLSYPSFEENVASKYMELAPAAHAKDVVTAILADWRGLDTLGEVTVLAVILVGLGSFFQLGRKE